MEEAIVYSTPKFDQILKMNQVIRHNDASAKLSQDKLSYENEKVKVIDGFPNHIDHSKLSRGKFFNWTNENEEDICVYMTSCIQIPYYFESQNEIYNEKEDQYPFYLHESSYLNENKPKIWDEQTTKVLLEYYKADNPLDIKRGVDYKLIHENIDEIIEEIDDIQFRNDTVDFWKADKALANV
ncbi:5921_t:CDS:2 [Funneliformis mosseae]|uniref:5921_t:CDS:1 n=1 Tax=Funneliformis mosseae TaxID=27381 RepID=A0A9N8ZDB6_FUNMO|nr:5921_t:CDS:2 [Funneliformis mosseae]